jgi:hypothetical protein
MDYRFAPRGDDTMKRARRHAYTLMEVMLVMAIMIVLLAVSYPAVDSLSAGIKVEAGGDAVRAAWAEGQAHAVNEGRPYRFAIVPGKGNYRLAPHSADYWSGIGSMPAPADPENPPIVLENSLPKGVVFAGGVFPGEEDQTSLPDGSVDPALMQPVAVFLPDGTAEEDTELIVEISGARPVILRLRALTGVVTVSRGG